MVVTGRPVTLWQARVKLDLYLCALCGGVCFFLCGVGICVHCVEVFGFFCAGWVFVCTVWRCLVFFVRGGYVWAL